MCIRIFDDYTQDQQKRIGRYQPCNGAHRYRISLTGKGIFLIKDIVGAIQLALSGDYDTYADIVLLASSTEVAR